MDTIIIKIYGPNKFTFNNKYLFLPELSYRNYDALTPTEKKTRNSSRPYLRKFILHSNIKDEYIPNVEVFETLSKEIDKTIYIMRITFSLPKLLYWNSIQEAVNVDAQLVVNKLKKALGLAGITFKDDAVENATVEAVHFCKNILLPKEITMRDIIEELSKIDLTKASDLMERRIKNNGQVLTLYSGIIEHTFYNKIADIERTKNKRSDKTNVSYEKTLVNEYSLKNTEIFRYEFRIKKTATVKSKVNKILGRDSKTPVVFNDLFSEDLSKNILIKNWSEIITKPENQLALFDEKDKTQIMLHIFEETKRKEEKAHGMNNAFTYYGIIAIIKDFGVKELKRIVEMFWNKDHPERLTKKIKNASDIVKNMPYKANIAYITEKIREHEIINLTSLKKGI